MWCVDTSEAPKDHPDLAGTIQDIQNNLGDPGFVGSLCLHECAHAIYWGFLERAAVPDYTIRIRKNPSDGGCSIEYAAMVLVNPTEPKECTVLGLAKAHAAGGVASEILAPGYERGDSKDFKNFLADILAVTSATSHDIEEVWQTAREEIKTEIQSVNSTIRADIERRAVEFERNFRLVSEVRDNKSDSPCA